MNPAYRYCKPIKGTFHGDHLKRFVSCSGHLARETILHSHIGFRLNAFQDAYNTTHGAVFRTIETQAD